jgi:hypothetical protein
MPLPAFVVPVAALAAIGLLFRSKLKDAAHTANNDAQRVAANIQNAASDALAPKQSAAQIQATIAQAIAAGGVQQGNVIFSARDQVAMAQGLPPAFQAILSGPGEPASQATINMLKIAVNAGQGPNPATTLKTTIGGSLFDTAPTANPGQPDTSMVQVTPGDLLTVDMSAAGIPGGPGTTVFIVRALADMAANTIKAENVDPRVPSGLIMDVPFRAITGIEAHA